jgi:hypothetical protein
MTDGPDELRAQARKCRDLAAGILDEDTRNKLRLLARDYEKQAAQVEAEAHRPDMPKPE